MDWFVVGEWVLRLGMIPVVAYRRRLTSALSWLALVFFFPWVGALLYLFLAEHRMIRRVRRHEEVRDHVRTDQRLSFQEQHGAPPVLHGDARELGELTRRLGGFGVVGGNAVDVLRGDEDAMDRLVEDIDRAGDHVHLLFYIIEDDRTGRRVTDAVRRAAGRGVTCRILADAVGSRRFHRRLAPRLREVGVDVRTVLPFGLLLKRLRPLDLRNHRKLAVVDGRIGYTGSMNVMDYDVDSGLEGTPWRDVLVRLRGPAVQELQLLFHEDWEYNTGESLGEAGLIDDVCTPGDVAAQIVPSGPTARVESIHNLMVAIFDRAEERIVITTPYFIPDEPTRVALRLAAYRGVEIDIVVPARSESRFVTAAGQSYYEQFLDLGVRIREHRSGFLHAKTVTVDDELAMIGSANFDRRSFHLNFELNLLLYGQTAVCRVVALQEGYIADSRTLEADEWKERPFLRRLGQDIARLMSPLL